MGNAGPPAPHPGDLIQVDHMLPHVCRGVVRPCRRLPI